MPRAQKSTVVGVRMARQGTWLVSAISRIRPISPTASPKMPTPMSSTVVPPDSWQRRKKVRTPAP
jgi:hypothetical protein